MTKSLDATIDKEIADMDSIRNKEIDRCALAIEEEEKSQWMAGSYEDLIAAKKENVALQLEAEYRARLKDAYTQVCSQKILTNIVIQEALGQLRLP